MNNATARPLPEGEPEKRAAMMVQSLRAFTHSWLGLIPVVGMVFSVTALVWAFQAGRAEREMWNPARRYRRAGVWIAGIASAVWLVVDSLLLLAIVNSLASS